MNLFDLIRIAAVEEDDRMKVAVSRMEDARVSFLMNPRKNRKILAYPALDFYLAEPIHGDRTKKAPG